MTTGERSSGQLGTQQPQHPAKTVRTVKTTTRTVSSTQARGRQPDSDAGIAVVEEQARRPELTTSSRIKPTAEKLGGGDSRVTTVGTIAAKSSQSRIVIALLRDGGGLQLRVQEMRPGVFAVGADRVECAKYLEEHERLLANLRRQRQAPIDCWQGKYQRVAAKEPRMSPERKLVFACMGDNLQTCWRSLLGQLELRRRLLEDAANFYAAADSLRESLDSADGHVARSRRILLDGADGGATRFQQASDELRRLNQVSAERYELARAKQQRLVALIGEIAAGNLADSRPNHLLADGQNLANYISAYLDPLERRRLQLETVISSSRTTTTTKTTTTTAKSGREPIGQTNGATRSRNVIVREITNFNDLDLVAGWLNTKIEQLNSSLLSSLGLNAQDSRSILSKHEQIALECSAIEESTLNFNGKNVHAIRSLARDDLTEQSPRDRDRTLLFERQKQLATRARDVITILDARLVLLRRTIDFYVRAREAAADLAAMMRRLQVDDSLQSVQVVASELELKDVSAVVASGATVISELQQLQLAQKHGQRSDIVNLNLVTSGVRAIIDQLSQELGQLKTVLSQRKLVLMNEDAAKRKANFANKCHQLQFWLDNHAKSFLLANSQLPIEVKQSRDFCDRHEQMRTATQAKTLEVEALLRLLATLGDSSDPETRASEIHNETNALRLDWIRTTSCLDKRIELARRHLALLTTANDLSVELDSLDRRPKRPARGGAGAAQPDDRAQAKQLLAQLGQQVEEFAAEAPRTNTEIVATAPTSDGKQKQVISDLNKQPAIDHARQLVNVLGRRVNQKAGAPLAAADEGLEPVQAKKVGSPREANTTPRFTRPLVDIEAEPFSTVELVCNVEPSAGSQVEWQMNNLKRIPPNVRHSISSSGDEHKLTISHFGPTACGLFSARLTTASGETATSKCRLRLAGIAETAEESGVNQRTTRTTVTRETTSERTTRTNSSGDQAASRRPIERIVQGVDSRDQSQSPNLSTDVRRLPVSQSTYSGRETTTSASSALGNQLRVPYVVSPASSTQSPLEGTPQPPVFVQPLSDSMPTCCSRAGLVCLVVANPPPTIEWLHNDTPIAVAKCPRPAQDQPARGNVCKLTIETVSPKTQGQYVCRATNRLGQTATEFQLAK